MPRSIYNLRKSMDMNFPGSRKVSHHPLCLLFPLALLCFPSPPSQDCCNSSITQVGCTVALSFQVKISSSGWKAPEKKVFLRSHVSQENLIRFFFLLCDGYRLYLIVPICWPFLKIQHSVFTLPHSAQSERLWGAWHKALC